MAFRKVNLEEFGISYQECDDSGSPIDVKWLHFDKNKVTRSMSDVRSILRRMSKAYERIASRNQKLIEASVSAEKSPARGYAIKDNEVRAPEKWLNLLNQLFLKHYGDVLDYLAAGNKIPNDLNRHKLVAAAHESFQWRKMGYYGPTKPGALREAQMEYLRIVEENHSVPFTVEDIRSCCQAIELMFENDFATIGNGKLEPKDTRSAVIGANIHGTAGGFIQASRDMYTGGRYFWVLKKEVEELVNKHKISRNTAIFRAKRVNQYEHHPDQLIQEWEDLDYMETHRKELERYYNIRIPKKMPYYDVIIKVIKEADINFDVNLNLITNFVRTQVGGLSVKDDQIYNREFFEHYEFGWDKVAKAKTRMIMAQDPIYMVPSAQIIQSVDDAFRDHKISFRAGLYDPITNYSLLEQQYVNAHSRGNTLAPLDFKLHDAWLHVDWLINICDKVYRPLFKPKDQWMIDYMILSFCYKTYMIPSFSDEHIDFRFGYGGLDSGHPSTNNIGSNGTRSVAALNAIISPEAFDFHSDSGCNKGDDYMSEARKAYILTNGWAKLVQLADENARIARYHFNQSKLFMVDFEDGSLVGHWDQRAHYYDESKEKLYIIASALRYGSRVYGCERVGSRVSPEEGICDQVSVLNNIVSYMGEHTSGHHLFSIEALGLDILSKYVSNDPVLLSYLSDNPKSYMKKITRKILGKMSVDDYLKRRGVNPFDEDATRQMIGGDYSFTPVVWLMAKGSSWLESQASKYVGGTILFYINEHKDPVIVESNGEPILRSSNTSITKEEELSK